METQTDVNQVSSPEQVVNEQNVTQEIVQPEQNNQVEVPQNLPLPTEGNTVADEEVDEMGVPYKNRFMESKRKLDKTSSELAEMKEMIQQLAANQQQPEEQTYTIADIEAYKAQNPNLKPQELAMLEAEKARLLKEEIVASVRGEYEQREKTKQDERLRSEALNTVAKQYPDVFIKDASGRTVWNTASPLVQRMNQYAQDPLIANRPDGVALAAKLAYGDLAQAGLLKAQSQVNARAAEVGDLQRRTAIESGAIGNVNTGSPVVNAINNLRQTGSREDARSAFKSMLFGNK